MKKSKPPEPSALEWALKFGAYAFLFWNEHKARQADAERALRAAVGDLPSRAPEIAHEKKQDDQCGRQRALDAERADLKQAPFWKRLWQIALSAAREWSAHRAGSKGAALALYMLFSLAPMLILIVTIAGFFFGDDVVRESLVQQMSGLMGEEGADAIKTMLAGGQSEDNWWVAGLISAVLVLVSATSAFSELKDSLDELWEVPPSTESGIWSVIRQRFLSFGLILVLALMLLATLGVSAALTAIGSLWGDGDGSLFHLLALALSNVFSFAVLTGLFAVIYKYLPAVKIAWKDVLVGALLTAVLFMIGKFAIGTYIGQADISSSYGAAGSVVVLITWIYYSAQIFFYGSLFTHEYAMKVGSRAGEPEVAKPAS